MTNSIKLVFLFLILPFFFNLNNEVIGNENKFSKNTKLAFQTFSFELFMKEFIYTNSNDDYIRSVKRLNENFLISLSIDYKDKINKKITANDYIKINASVKKLIKEAKLKSLFKNNTFYKQIKNIIDTNIKWNSSVLYERLIVKELLKANRKSVYGEAIPNNIYYLHILNNLRYEIILSFLKNKK